MSEEDDSLIPVGRISQHDKSKLRRAWQQSPAVWRFVPERGDRKHIRRWLGKQSRDDWHEIALNFDMDQPDLAPLSFIASRRDCDRASVLTILLALDPARHEALRARDPSYDPAEEHPEATRLLNKIADGFAKGYYSEAQFRIGQSQSVFRQVADSYTILETPPIWSFPERAWAPTNGKDHNPDYVWDRSDSCQRIPFEIWVKTKLRPN